MITKALEIRDRATFIPVIAIKMVPILDWPASTKAERYLLRRAGFGSDFPSIMLCRMNANGGVRQASYDSYNWGGRTLSVAHKYIIDYFDQLENGDVVDVEFILKETALPKKSERET